eukprot:scaffold3998_cov61-Phaeocystis_antarctica.AAC.14
MMSSRPRHSGKEGDERKNQKNVPCLLCDAVESLIIEAPSGRTHAGRPAPDALSPCRPLPPRSRHSG